MTDVQFPKLVPSRLPELTAWSYSRYNDYKLCPFKFAYKHLLRIKEPAGPAMERGSKIHSMAETFVTAKRKPKMPDELKNFSDEINQLRDIKPLVEQQWGFTKEWEPTGWFASDTYCRIVTDVCAVYEDNTADVIDYKTGRKYGENEDQMELFAVGTFYRFSDLTDLTTRLWYLDIADEDEHEVKREYARKELKALTSDWNKRIRPMFRDRKFAPRPNDKCKWCYLSKDKGGPCKF